MSYLPPEICEMADKLRCVLTKLGLLDHVVIVGGVAKCLSGVVCCSEVGDLDIAIDEIMAERYWKFCRGAIASRLCTCM